MSMVKDAITSVTSKFRIIITSWIAVQSTMRPIVAQLGELTVLIELKRLRWTHNVVAVTRTLCMIILFVADEALYVLRSLRSLFLFHVVFYLLFCCIFISNSAYSLRMRRLFTHVIARFECPKLENDGKCHVNGNSYNLNEKLDSDNEPLCSAACYCAKTIEWVEHFPKQRSSGFNWIHFLNEI